MIYLLVVIAAIVVCSILSFSFFHDDWSTFSDEKKKAIIFFTGIASIIFMVIVFSFGSKPSSSSRWDKLSKSEKQWYEDNYGNGQYDAIRDAIDNY